MPRAGEYRQTHGESSRRLLELKPAIDRIIDDARIDAEDLKQGISDLRNHQLDIIEQLDRSENTPDYRNDHRYEQYPYDSVPDPRRANHKQYPHRPSNFAINANQSKHQNKRLRKQSYKPDNIYDQEDYRPYDSGYNQYDSDYNDQQYNDRQYPAQSYHYPRDRESRGYNDHTRNEQSKDDIIRSLMAENSHLKSLVQQLEHKLHDAQHRLRRAQSRGGFAQLREELQMLKRENQDLRQNTILLLEKPSSSYNYSGNSSQQIHQLKQQIQNENRLKSEFLQELTKFKAKYKRCEQQKRKLQDQLSETRHGGHFHGGRGQSKGGSYQQKGYGNNNPNNNLNKYQEMLSEIRRH